jgi:hypothetical protein
MEQEQLMNRCRINKADGRSICHTYPVYSRTVSKCKYFQLSDNNSWCIHFDEYTDACTNPAAISEAKEKLNTEQRTKK